MSFLISKPAVRVNNEAIAVKPNSVEFDEGEGETTVETASLGGADVDVIISDNAEDKLGNIKFAVPATVKNIEQGRGWKKNPGVNVVEVSGEDPEGNSFSRIFRKQSISNNYMAGVKSGGDLQYDWKGAQPL